VDNRDNPSPEDDITQNQLDQAKKLAGSLNATVARAIRLQANGQEIDADQMRAQARDLVEQMLELLPPISEDRRALSWTPLDLMASYWQQQAARRDLASTGFASLDTALSGGLERDRLYVLLGPPGSGKTTLANQIADHIGRDRPVLYVSSEDSPMALLAKSIARRGMIEYSAVLRGYQSERDRINAAFADYREQPQARNIRYVDATQGVSLQEIAEQAERHFAAVAGSTKGDPVIVVDYLQRLARAEDASIRAATNGNGALGTDARLVATAYTERLRALACDLHCSVFCLSAMSRAGGYSASADRTLNAAKESGDIEYTADTIMAIGEQLENGLPITLPEPGAYAWCVTIAKNRQGLISATGARIELSWYPTLQKFVERDDSASEESDQGGTLMSRTGRGRYNRRRGQ
jgi:replicative DNA helicase